MKSMATSESAWISLANIPKSGYRQKFVVVFNEKTNKLFAFQQGNAGLMEYLFDEDLWIKHEIEPTLTLHGYRDFPAPTGAIDCDRNLIYLYDEGFVAQIRVDFDKNNKCKFKKMVKPRGYLGRAPKGTVINGEFHLIGFNQHWKYDQQKNEFVFCGNLCEDDEEDDHNGRIPPKITIHELVENHGLCQVKNEKILIFGGEDDGDCKRLFYKSYTNTIREYDVGKHEWRKLNVELPYKLMGCGATSVLDGKYVLIFGGDGKDH